MIACGVIKPSLTANHPYQVILPVDADCKNYVGFFVSNPEIIPFYLKQMIKLKNGISVAGVFEFVPADQFAEYIPTEDLIREK